MRIIFLTVLLFLNAKAFSQTPLPAPKPLHIVLPEVERYRAQTDRLIATGQYLESVAKAQLTLAEANYRNTKAAEVAQRIQFLNALLIELREDLKYLMTVQNQVNSTNAQVCKAIHTVRSIRRDGRLYKDDGFITSRIAALHYLLSLDVRDKSIEERLLASWAALTKIPSFKEILSEEGTILPFEGKSKGLGRENFVGRTIKKRGQPVEKSESKDFSGGSFYELLNFLESENLNLKLQSKAHRLFNAALTELERNAIDSINQLIDEYYLPVRKRILEYWATLHPNLTPPNEDEEVDLEKSR